MNMFHLLTLIFVIAKLMGAIAWSWWLVFLPSILFVAFAIIFMVLVIWAASTR